MLLSFAVAATEILCHTMVMSEMQHLGVRLMKIEAGARMMQHHYSALSCPALSVNADTLTKHR